LSNATQTAMHVAAGTTTQHHCCAAAAGVPPELRQRYVPSEISAAPSSRRREGRDSPSAAPVSAVATKVSALHSGCASDRSRRYSASKKKKEPSWFSAKASQNEGVRRPAARPPPVLLLPLMLLPLLPSLGTGDMSSLGVESRECLLRLHTSKDA